MAYVSVEQGVDLYYEDYGAGAPVVFIHGGGMSHEMWEQQVYVLTDEFRTLAYDQRGNGQSDKPDHGYAPDELADDLEALLRQCRIDRFHLVCHGVGVHIGLTLALRHQDRVRGVALVAAGAQFLNEQSDGNAFASEQWTAYLEGMARNKIEAASRLVNDMFFHHDPGEATRRAYVDMSLQWPLYAFKLFNQGMKASDLGNHVADLAVPTLLLHGRHDMKQPVAGARRLAEVLPDARLVTFEDSAHCPQLEEAERFNHILADFINNTL